ncbi:uncharacterized protein LOC104583948 [Brachypodium distachyon]|uniref:Uncharacterized protein n=1 Tax=Brachypodium distachyon TaxID=15368 RepID=A0A0Q3F2C0_BRADI|nr:uncharacterized protein LOC104583948 [Brachypodium distachyon]KQJ93607.1 hypothetical protein BRADI_3g05693v3 [Brachypodium distachyon]|eukprot:XP_010236292.1 uncharacterized protein LOC104583948 [Brachypodium distachyon]
MGIEIDQSELLSRQLPPVRTSAGAGDDDDGCATPTAAANVLPVPSACPPAPRKPRPAARATKRTKRLCCCHRGRRYWIVAVPRDLDLAAVFATRPPSSSAAGGGSLACSWPAAAAKKVRVHVTG